MAKMKKLRLIEIQTGRFQCPECNIEFYPMQPMKSKGKCFNCKS